MSIARCPFCDSPHVKVVDSRPIFERKACRRRYLCTKCNERFSTLETIMRGGSGAAMYSFIESAEENSRIIDEIRKLI